MPKIQEEIEVPKLQMNLARRGYLKIKDYWGPNDVSNPFRQWKKEEWFREWSSGEDISNLTHLLEERKIEIKDSPDQIRWGYKSPGQFNVKEVVDLASGAALLPAEKKWCRLWNLGHWLKKTLFLWLLMWGRILTWENLKRRGMVGPSRCVMCQQAEETTPHLIQDCEWAIEVWEKGEAIFDKLDLNSFNIQDMDKTWAKKAFKNPILNRIWEVFLGFVLWEIWKERNHQIFEGRTHKTEEAWHQIQNHTNDILGLKQWGANDLKVSTE